MKPLQSLAGTELADLVFSRDHSAATRLHQEKADHIAYLCGQMAQIDVQIAQVLKPYQSQYDLLQTMAGIRKEAAAAILAEKGPDMRQFPTAAHLASWSALCPANNESAGKHRAGKSKKGNQWLGATLNQCAWAASVKKGCSLGDRYRRIAARRGQEASDRRNCFMLKW